MVPIRLAFRQEFERDLKSTSLRDWFERMRDREPLLHEFADPETLCRFVQAKGRHPSKPQIWRALVRSFQIDPAPARTFLLGVLEPVLDHLMDRFTGDDLDAEDLWQETITCAVAALSNPRLSNRRAVLVGLLLDTFHELRHWLRRELSRAKNVDSLPEELSAPSRTAPRGTADEEDLLAAFCRQAGVSHGAFELIRVTRLQQTPLTELAPHRSAAYERLKWRRRVAERRLKTWLVANQFWPGEAE
jgi:DNA-directed RNA polymerase specialized sigma24 family protein